MALITFRMFPGLLEHDRDIDDGSLTTATGKKAVFTDSSSGDMMIFEGNGLDYEGDALSAGTLRKFSIVDASGEKFVSVEGFSFDGRFLKGATVMDQASAFAELIVEEDLRFIGANSSDTMSGYNGNDLMLGRRGDDMINGWFGKDMLVGGAGNDVFVFAKGYGNDTIRDFDADGGDGFQDQIDAEFGEIRMVTQSGKNTVINFGDGDVLTLLNIKPSQIDESDFV